MERIKQNLDIGLNPILKTKVTLLFVFILYASINALDIKTILIDDHLGPEVFVITNLL